MAKVRHARTSSQAEDLERHPLTTPMIRRTVLRDICLIMFVVLLIYGVNNIYDGYVYLGIIDAAVALAMLINAWRLQRMDSEGSGAMHILLAGAAATLVAVYFRRYGEYWSYIVVAVSFLVVDKRSAAIFSLAFIMLVVAFLVFFAELAIGVRVGVTLLLLATISYIFSTRVDKKHQKLISYSHELEKADAARSEFVANMSHEMRTPLTIIMGYAESTLDNGHLDPKSRENLVTILSSSKSLSFLIEEVIDLTIMERGQVALHTVRLELAPYLREISQIWSSRAEEKRIHFSLNTCTSLPAYLEVDSVRLNQILSNLLGNAIKFTDSGSVELQVEYTAQEQRLKFGVIDTGSGVPIEFRDSLFEKFTQADSSETRKQGGIGLGLFISKSLAKMLDAELIYVPQSNGSLFELSLAVPGAPDAWIEAGDLTSLKVAPDPLPASQFRGRVLIAEDSRAIQLLIGLIVEQMGMSYTLVDDGQAAVDAMRAESFDLVLMDLQMPILSGIDATAEIRQFNDATPIVALSSDVLLYDKDAEQLSGFSDLLPKPVERKSLKKVFEKFLPG